MRQVKEVLHKETGGDGACFRFKLKIPTLEKCDISNLESARSNAVNLSEAQLARLESLTRFISIFRFAYFPINTKVSPTFYELGLFTGSTCLWCDAYKWLLLENRHKYADLDMDLTLVLLTAVLAGSNDGLGADRWYRMGVTYKLLKHLTELIREEQKYGRK